MESLPIDILKLIKSYVPKDKLASSPTAKLIHAVREEMEVVLKNVIVVKRCKIQNKFIQIRYKINHRFPMYFFIYREFKQYEKQFMSHLESLDSLSLSLVSSLA
jgi:hypothetical protein